MANRTKNIINAARHIGELCELKVIVDQFMRIKAYVADNASTDILEGIYRVGYLYMHDIDLRSHLRTTMRFERSELIAGTMFAGDSATALKRKRELMQVLSALRSELKNGKPIVTLPPPPPPPKRYYYDRAPLIVMASQGTLPYDVAKRILHDAIALEMGEAEANTLRLITTILTAVHRTIVEYNPVTHTLHVVVYHKNLEYDDVDAAVRAVRAVYAASRQISLRIESCVYFLTTAKKSAQAERLIETLCQIVPPSRVCIEYCS